MSETKERKTDRRVEKTKQAMRHAFVELLKRKPYNAITISELTREADIDRRTFYLHYESIEDLVKEMQKIARDAITEQLKQRGIHSAQDVFLAACDRNRKLVNYGNDRKELCTARRTK